MKPKDVNLFYTYPLWFLLVLSITKNEYVCYICAIKFGFWLRSAVLLKQMGEKLLFFLVFSGFFKTKFRCAPKFKIMIFFFVIG